LQAALNSALAAAPGRDPLAIAIVALNPGGDRPLAQVRGDEEYYSASLMKVCAMYAAYELREVLRGMAKVLGGNGKAANFFQQVSKYLNPLIVREYKKIPLFANLPTERGLPKYKDIFSPTDGASGIDVDFSGKFENDKGLMITMSDNDRSRNCIHALGFGYIGAVLAAGGFFDPTANNGLWLAGDFQNHREWPYVPIRTLNIGPAGQAATVRQLASLYTLMYDRKLVSPTASADMLDDLVKPVLAGECWINRLPSDSPGETINFAVDQTKIGVGDPPYYSESSIVRHIPSNRAFVAAWQNVLFGKFPGDIDSVSRVIRDTLKAYLGP
jgi:hypothetical protein